MKALSPSHWTPGIPSVQFSSGLFLSFSVFLLLFVKFLNMFLILIIGKVREIQISPTTLCCVFLFTAFWEFFFVAFERGTSTGGIWVDKDLRILTVEIETSLQLV